MKDDDLEQRLAAHVEDLVKDIAPDARHDGYVRIVDENTRVFAGGLRAGKVEHNGQLIGLLEWICQRKRLQLPDARTLAEVLLSECANDALNGAVSHAPPVVEQEPVREADFQLVPGRKTLAVRARRETETEYRPHKPEPVRLLPQSVEAEKGLLGSFIFSPLPMGAFCRDKNITPAHFAMPAHAVIFETMMYLSNERIEFDLVLLTQQLRDMKLLDQAGGYAFVTELLNHIPTAANAPRYVEILHEKHALREAIKYHTFYGERAYTEQDRVWEFIEESRSRAVVLADTAMDSRGLSSGQDAMSWKDLVKYDTANDEDCILGLGRRWLCRGGSCLLTGGSGIGKSSLAMQMGMYWAAGMPAFGIKPKGQLKSLFIQAENDRGDLAEMIQGVTATVLEGLPLDNKTAADAWERNIIIIRDAVHTGAAFAESLRRLVRTHKPDLIWIDPLFSYVGDDLSKQAVASYFLRNLLNPIAAETGVCFMVVHHMGKPSADSKSKAHWTDADQSYAFFGSSEILNWARASCRIEQVKNSDVFELTLAKRGKRAGARDLDGDYTTKIYIAHADHGISWQQVAKPEGSDGKDGKVKYAGSLFVGFIKAAGGAMTRDQLRDAVGRPPVLCPKNTAYRRITELLAEGRIEQTLDGLISLPE